MLFFCLPQKESHIQDVQYRNNFMRHLIFLLLSAIINSNRYIFAETAAKIADEAETLMMEVTKILKNHIPVHLKKLAKDMAYFRLFEDAISAPVSILCNRKFLLPFYGEDVLPTTYVILK